jgi:outer membrane protein insertion porin family
MRAIQIEGSLRRGVTAVALAGATLLFAGPHLEAQIPDPPAQAPPGQEVGIVVDSLVVEGNRWLEDGLILATIQIEPGMRVTYRELQDAERRLWGTGRFEDVQVIARGGETPDDPVVFVFRVEERPTVRTFRVEGLENLNPREVQDSVGLRSGDSYSPQRIVEARHMIRTRLADKGIPFAAVEEEITPASEDEGEVHVVLRVTEGHRVTVAEVVFRGNEAFRDSELREVLSTRQEGFWWFRSGDYRQDELEADLAERLPEFYASSGFLDFRVAGDSLIIDPETGKARLEVAVEEGPQYRLGGFGMEGNRRFPTQELEQYYTTERGGLLRSLGIGSRRTSDGPPVFDRSAFVGAAGEVERRYRNEGYLYVRVEPVIDRVPTGESNDGHPTVDVRWRIEEGPQAFVNRVSIEGNTFTHDRVIREQIAILPGDVYSEERVIRSYQAISGLGFFQTPLPDPKFDHDEETGDVDITFVVEEQQTGSINFGTTMGGVMGISGFVGYEQPNLFGQAKAGSLRWDFGTYQNNFHIQYADPALFESRVSGMVSLFDSRDRFFSFATGERKQRGGLVRFGVPVPGSRYARVYAGYSLSRTDFRLREGADDASLFGRPPGTQSQVMLGVTRRAVDHPIFPTVGSILSVDNEFSGGILGGDGNFSKHQVRGEWWVPVGRVGGGGPGERPIIFSLGLRARAGTIFGDADRFPFDRFWLGGVQFGEQLRGYDETTITPLGYFPRGSGQVRDIDRLGDTFLSLGAEYAIRLNDNISVSAFYDAGNVWRTPREIDPSRLFRGAGVGAMLVTPFGPVGLDFAYGFDKDVPGWQLHFRMGGPAGGGGF